MAERNPLDRVAALVNRAEAVVRAAIPGPNAYRDTPNEIRAWVQSAADVFFAAWAKIQAAVLAVPDQVVRIQTDGRFTQPHKDAEIAAVAGAARQVVEEQLAVMRRQSEALLARLRPLAAPTRPGPQDAV